MNLGELGETFYPGVGGALNVAEIDECYRAGWHGVTLDVLAHRHPWLSHHNRGIQMSDVDHVDVLTAIREKMVAGRRAAALKFSEPIEGEAAFMRYQAQIDAVDRAIADETSSRPKVAQIFMKNRRR